MKKDNKVVVRDKSGKYINPTAGTKVVGYAAINDQGKVVKPKVYKTKSTAKGQATKDLKSRISSLFKNYRHE